MCSWRGTELTWRVAPPHGCDAALRPPGRAVGGPRKAQMGHRARTHGRRPHVSTRVHADARVGRHMAMGWQMEGPWVSGPWLGDWGGNAKCVTASHNLSLSVFFFSSVWDYVPHVSYLLQATWMHCRSWMRSGRRRSRGPESTRSSNKHVPEITRKWTRSRGLPNDTWRRRKRQISITIWSWWIVVLIGSSVDGRDLSRSETPRGHIRSVRSSSYAGDYTTWSEERWTRGGLTSARSSSDGW